MFGNLNEIQINVLIASIIGDGELTKLYKNSRRRNSSYREHYGENQKEYREWKVQIMDGLFYIRPKSHTLCSASSPFFTNLLKLFYNETGKKTIPPSLLPNCKHPSFLAVLFMDDGTLSITSKVNHNKKRIYLTPHIYLYLQNYFYEDLLILKNHIKNQFNLDLHFGYRNDGSGIILRTTSVKETFAYLDVINDATVSCPSMFYKTNWNFRLKLEEDKWGRNFPNYTFLVTSSERNKNYSIEEIKKLISLKNNGKTDKEIALTLSRSYWSIVYKLRELRKDGIF
ncbi:DNA endonuclease [Neobacillus sp. NPDC093127]|uniref:DNA endonuclease n=1 Tax=Neobacillus sp. NPDC093127 TaxID=3364296 RepID=UPI003808AA2C